MERLKQSAPEQKRVFLDQLVTLEDLEQFKQDILGTILGAIKETQDKPTKKWIKSEEVKDLLQISHGTLQTLRDNGTLPFTKIGNLIYYDIDDINRVLFEKKKN